MAKSSAVAHTEPAVVLQVTAREPGKPERPRLAVTVCVAAWLVLILAVALRQSSLPSVAATRPATAFSAEKAARHLAVLAERPRPAGSDQWAKAQGYIVQELRNLGLAPQTQSSRLVRGSQVIDVKNIVAIIPGTEQQAVLLVAHFDSVPNSPGAADDGSGVSILLETARALVSGPPLRRTVILLFSDGEELGLNGAYAFAKDNELMKTVALVLNFDARGDSGPALMFETQPNPGSMINWFARSAPFPVASSLMPEIYRRLGNDTDFTVFRQAGLPGFNFAFIDREIAYHTAADSVSALDLESLQHGGDTALALVRRYQETGVSWDQGKNMVYFNLFPGTLFAYSARWAVPLALLSTALWLIAILAGRRRQRLTMRGIVIAGGSAFLSLVLVPALMLFAWKAVLLVHNQYDALPYGDVYHNTAYRIGISALAIAIASLVYAVFRRLSAENAWVGAMAWYAVLSLCSSILAPGASYLFTWPLLCFSAAFLIVIRANWRPASLAFSAVMAVAAAPAILLLVPTIRLMFWVFTFSFLVPAALLLALLCMLLLPQLELLVRWRRWLPVGCALAVCLLFLVIGGRTIHASPTTPWPSNLFYAAEAGSHKGYWMSKAAQPDAWNSLFLGKSPTRESCATVVPFLSGVCLTAPAPYVDLPAPAVQATDEERQGNIRSIRLKVKSMRNAPIVIIAFDKNAGLISIEADGKPLNLTKGAANDPSVRVALISPPSEGEEIVCRIQGLGKVRIVVTDRSYGLEPVQGYVPRPAALMAGGRESDSIFVTAEFVL